MQGALQTSINPNPFFIRRGFNLIPKSLSPLQGRDLICYGHKPPSAKDLVWFTELSPFG